MRPCGGCDGQGAHWRWCREKVGVRASILGPAADRAEDLGDTVGANFTQGANALYTASAILRKEAQEEALQFIAHQVTREVFGGTDSEA